MIIQVKLPDDTVTAYSLGEYLAWRTWLGWPVHETDLKSHIAWHTAFNNDDGRFGCLLSVISFRKTNPNDPAVQTFRQIALDQEIPF